jgi:hypothetical protein
MRPAGESSEKEAEAYAADRSYERHLEGFKNRGGDAADSLQIRRKHLCQNASDLGQSAQQFCQRKTDAVGGVDKK